MTLLLDTHAIIWFLDGSPLLSENARTAILNPNNERLVSVASIWELSIKSGLGKFSFDGGMSGFLKLLDVNGFDILPISVEHAISVASLHQHHRDPFDRLLVAQCACEGFTLVSTDPEIQRYGIRMLW